MMDKIKSAIDIAGRIRKDLISANLKKLEEAIEDVSKFMENVGFTELCRICAEEFGSCCRKWVEDEVDEILLAINILMGVKLPERRLKDDLCFFLGRNGCTLKVKPDLCLSYVCEYVRENIGVENEKRLQRLVHKAIELNRRVRFMIVQHLL